MSLVKALLTWLKKILSLSQPVSKNHVPWYLLFACGIWNLWLNRNAIVFKDNGSTIPDLVRASYHQAASIAFLGPPLFNPRPILAPFLVDWNLQLTGFEKLNTDGYCLAGIDPINRGGAGSVIRNDKGAWVHATSWRLLGISSEAAELWAVFNGLSLA